MKLYGQPINNDGRFHTHSLHLHNLCEKTEDKRQSRIAQKRKSHSYPLSAAESNSVPAPHTNRVFFTVRFLCQYLSFVFISCDVSSTSDWCFSTKCQLIFFSFYDFVIWFFLLLVDGWIFFSICLVRLNLIQFSLKPLGWKIVNWWCLERF